jgi:fumarate hydratase subunit alpha
MRELTAEKITQAVALAMQEMHFQIRPDLKIALEKVRQTEVSPSGKQVMDLLMENLRIAGQGKLPLCQDTGLTILFVDMGQDAHVVNGSLAAALQEGVRQATQEAHLRHSVAKHPLTRGNTGDNTPAIIHYNIVPGDQFKIVVLAKGGGCENASALAMLTPAAGSRGISDFVVQTVKNNGAAGCPPLFIGVGLGGDFETAPFLAKHALLRKIGEPSKDPELSKLESEILIRINALGLGPQGWGGTVTAMAVAIEAAPCHIASLPVAVNIECHSHRHVEVSL